MHRREVDVSELVRQSRASQGLPSTVEDPATLAAVARLIVSSWPRDAHAEDAKEGWDRERGER